MIITSLVLKGYKRFLLNNIREFSISFSSMVQIIAGTNGSGKSSLIYELSPLPAEQNNYSKDGAKIIKITHHNSSYVLKSDFSSSLKHSFLKDGIELNSGGTITIQRELVKQEFGITQEIHELLIGLELFHNMSPARRREWFTVLSDVSYDYALSIYNKLRERSRDITGALKIARNRFVTESSKVISQIEEDQLISSVEQLHRELNLLIGQNAPVTKPSHEYEKDYHDAAHELSRLSNQLLNIKIIAPYGTYPDIPLMRNEWYQIVENGICSISEIDAVLDKFRQNIAAKEALINNAVNEFNKINRNIEILLETNEMGTVSLQDRLAQIVAKKKEILSKRKLSVEITDPVQSLNALQAAYDTLVHVFSNLTVNEDRRYSQQRLTTLEEQLLIRRDARVSKVNELTVLNGKKIHMESHKTNNTLTCPNCQYVWVNGYSDKVYDDLLRSIGVKEEELSAFDKDTVSLENELLLNKEYRDLYRSYVVCTKNFPILNAFWEYLVSERYVSIYPNKVLSILELFKSDILVEIDATKCDDDINETTRLIKSVAEVGDANLSELKTRLKEYETLIDTLTSELTKLKNNLNNYRQYRQQLIESEELSNRIATLSSNLEQINGDMIEMIRRETMSHCIRQLQHSLAIKQETLNNTKIQKGIVADLQKQIESLTLEDESAKLLVKQLSPTDGLIAEGLLGFINHFVRLMNGLIKEVWVYPLQVMSCGTAGDTGAELDYKFPMLVQNKSNIIPDVKLGSAGQKEIVNLAFRIMAMKALRLEDYIVVMDEWGSNLDAEHRNASVNFIKTLMNREGFSQLFMVNHSDNIFNVFNNAEICVLDKSNVVVPDEYNKHVVIN